MTHFIELYKHHLVTQPLQNPLFCSSNIKKKTFLHVDAQIPPVSPWVEQRGKCLYKVYPGDKSLFIHFPI
jgi:hypothetical protein